MPNSLQPPMCAALIIADTIWHDAISGQPSILGVFSTAQASEFPCRMRLAVYVALIDGRGSPELKIRIVDADEDLEPLADVQFTVDFSDPRATVEVEVTLTEVVFPESGEYWVQVYCDGDFLTERSLRLLPPEDAA